MSSNYYRICCENCENLRIDNFCLIKEKYILTKNITRRRECISFSCKKIENLFPDLPNKMTTKSRKELLEYLKLESNSK